MPNINTRSPLADQKNIIQPPHFSNWADQFMPKIANKLLPFVLPFDWITPNGITLTSFALYALGCIFLFVDIPYNFLFTAILLPFAYILDCLDGQLARQKKLFSAFGNYLDCVLDFLKIFILTFSVSFQVYLDTKDTLYLLLGFVACFFFTYRFYIKYITMYTQLDKDPLFLEKSKKMRSDLFFTINQKNQLLTKTIFGKLHIFLVNNSTIFLIDEAELVIFTSVAVLFHRLDLVLWVFAIGQTTNALFRMVQRGYQIRYQEQNLLNPIRK